MSAKSFTADPSAPDQSDGWTAPSPHLAELLHLSTLPNLESSSLNQRAKFSAPRALFLFVFHSIHNWICTLLVSPYTVFFDPGSTLGTLVVYPFIFVFLFVTVVVLGIFNFVGGGHLVDWAANTWAGGYSVVNWGNPEIFGPQSTQDINAARPFLGGEPTTYPAALSHNFDPAHPHGRTTRIFSLPLAKSFLLFSSLVYERSDRLVMLAVGRTIDGTPFDVRIADQHLRESERKIREQAERWELGFEGVSDLATPSGAFASIFWERREGAKKWIALVFKGTSPSNFAEFLVDCAINRVPGGVFFGDGTVHQGFYSDLFPTTEGGSDGYGTIVDKLKEVAERMRGPSDPPIPLWVTGHSLGSALASLAYARFLHTPTDLGPSLSLRDCYSYGTPRLGDARFVSSFEANAVTPVERGNILWRVVNAWDVVCQVPPGLADAEERRATLLESPSLFNYAHVGAGVVLAPKVGPFYAVQTAAFHHATKVEVRGTPAGVEGKGGEGKPSRGASIVEALREAAWNPLKTLVQSLPAPIYNHFPASYYEHLDLIKPEERVEAVGSKKRGPFRAKSTLNGAT